MQKKILAGALIALTFATPSLAGQLSVNPIKINLTPQDKISVFTASNVGNYAVTMEASLMKWQQNDKGQWDLTKTTEAGVYPRHITIEPGSQETVRVGFIQSPDQDGDKELSYRLVLTEVPSSNPQGTGISVRTKINIPVFYRGKNFKDSKSENVTLTEAVWTGDVANDPKTGVAGGLISFTAKNNGNAHFAPNQGTYTFYHKGREVARENAVVGANYILPSSLGEWRVFFHGSCASVDRVDVKISNLNLSAPLRCPAGN